MRWLPLPFTAISLETVAEAQDGMVLILTKCVQLPLTGLLTLTGLARRSYFWEVGWFTSVVITLYHK